jgi:hypothetical protein
MQQQLTTTAGYGINKNPSTPWDCRTSDDADASPIKWS